MILVPNEFARCTILIECQLADEKIIEKIGYKINNQIEVILGLGTTTLSQTIDKTLLTLAVGEKFELNISDFELGTGILVINLIKFANSTPIHQLEPEEFLNRAKELKDRGTDAFKKKDIEAAFYLFSRASKYILCLTVEMKTSGHLKFSPDKKLELQNLKCLCHLNLAACQLLGTNLSGVVKNCEEALKIDPVNIKAYFRRGQAQIKLKEYDSAINDLKRVLELEPNNKQATKLLNDAKSQMQEDNKHLGDKLKNMFS